MRTISNIESTILYRKYRSEGLSIEEAGERIIKIKNHLRKLVIKLEKKNKKKEEINNRFKEEFFKLIEKET